MASDAAIDERGLPADHQLHPLEITPRDTKRLLDERAQGENDDFVLIDCRLPQEAAITKIDGAELIPVQLMQQHAERLKEWRDKKVVIYCRSGGRSLQFAQLLKHNGFNDVKSMAGGVLLWNRDINPGGPQY
jgi:sulfur-carrier protein adenylyltransferase/sulfurtransferase